jgi:hypothetical protein
MLSSGSSSVVTVNVTYNGVGIGCHTVVGRGSFIGKCRHLLSLFSVLDEVHPFTVYVRRGEMSKRRGDRKNKRKTKKELDKKKSI